MSSPHQILLAAAGRYTTTALDLDGSTNYAQRGAGVTVCPDGKLGTFSCFFRRDGTGNHYLLDAASGGIMTVQFNTAHKLVITAANSGGSTLISRVSTNTFTSGATWHSLIASWNLNTGPVLQVYIDDAAETMTGTLNAGTIDYDRASGMNWTEGATTSGTGKFNGCLCEYFFHDVDLDLSVTANRRKLVLATNKPADKGADGSLVFSAQPRLYSKNADLSANMGSAGNYSWNGSKTTCSTSPTD